MRQVLWRDALDGIGDGVAVGAVAGEHAIDDDAAEAGIITGKTITAAQFEETQPAYIAEETFFTEDPASRSCREETIFIISTKCR